MVQFFDSQCSLLKILQLNSWIKNKINIIVKINKRKTQIKNKKKYRTHEKNTLVKTNKSGLS